MIYRGIENFRKCHDNFRQTRLSKISKAIIPIKEHDENTLEKKIKISNENRPAFGVITIEQVSFDFFNKLIFYKCGQILANTKKDRSGLTKKFIDDIISIMVSFYSEQVNHMLEVNDPGAIKGLNTQEDFILELPYIAADYLLLKDNRIATETFSLLDSLFSMMDITPDRFEKFIEAAKKEILNCKVPSLYKNYKVNCDNFIQSIQYYKEIQNRIIKSKN